jgi:hypothetical protein
MTQLFPEAEPEFLHAHSTSFSTSIRPQRQPSIVSLRITELNSTLENSLHPNPGTDT